MCKDIELFEQINRNFNHGKLNLANSACADIEGIGTVSFETCTSGKRKAIELGDTLFIPDLRANLISVGKITDKGYKVVFSDTKAKVIDRTDKVLLTAKRKKGLYYFSAPTDATAGRSPDRMTRRRWRRKIPSKTGTFAWDILMSNLSEAIKTGSIRGIDVKDISEEFQCHVWLQGKMCRAPFPKASERVTGTGQHTFRRLWPDESRFTQKETIFCYLYR